MPQAQRAQVEALVQDERNIELRELALRDFHSRPVLGLYSQQHGQLIDIAQRRVVHQVKVGKSPHGVWTIDHAARI